MNGLLRIRIQNKRYNWDGHPSFIAIVMLFVLVFSGCSSNWIAGDGRGDWQMPLQGGYSIDRVNSRQKVVIYNSNEKDSGGVIVIPQFYVVAYFEVNHDIFLKGISTQGELITDDELQNAEIIYFILNSNSGTIIGPLDEVQFNQQCAQKGIEPINNWFYLKD